MTAYKDTHVRGLCCPTSGRAVATRKRGLGTLLDTVSRAVPQRRPCPPGAEEGAGASVWGVPLILSKSKGRLSEKEILPSYSPGPRVSRAHLGGEAGGSSSSQPLCTEAT